MATSRKTKATSLQDNRKSKKHKNNENPVYHTGFLVYNGGMIDGKKLGAFIIPTGIGAEIGGYAGDAGAWARKFAANTQLIVNPNVVNAGCFSAITDNMLYVEGFSLDEFFRGNVGLKPAFSNKIGIVFDKAISQEILNIHINTINAVKTVYGIDVIGYEVSEEEVGVEFFLDSSKISTGGVKNIEALDKPIETLINQGAQAIAIVCKFEEETSVDYENGIGVDPIGGVEAIISHYVSKKYKIPCAHSPAFEDYSVSTKIVNPKAAAEYITPTFLPCIIIGLNNAPSINSISPDISINDLDFLIVPHDALGSIPVIECVNRGIKVFAIKENSTVLNVKKDLFFQKSVIITMDSYKQCLEFIDEEFI